MRKLSAPRGGGEKVGVLAWEVAAHMSRAAGLWRALEPGHLARLRGEAIRLEGVRRLVADDDAALLALALAEMATACRDLSRAVSRLSARCADPLLRRFDALFAAVLKRGAGSGSGSGSGGGDPHGLRYAADKKMDRKARKMQRLVAATAHLCHELDVLAELEQQLKQAQLPRRRGNTGGSSGSRAADCARRVARQRQEVERLRAASLWARTFDYAVRLLARSLFTIVARIIEVFDLRPVALLLSSASSSVDEDASSRASRLSWGASFVGGGIHSQHSMVYPSDAVIADAQAPPRKMLLRARSGDARRFVMSRSKSLRQQVIGCVVMGSSGSPGRDGWNHADHAPLSFSYVSAGVGGSFATAAADDDFSSSSSSSSSGIISFHSQAETAAAGDAARRLLMTTTTAVFDASRDVVTHPPEATLGAAALALHYANLIMLIERLAASPLHVRHIAPDERDALYGMLTGTLRASLRARLRPAAASPCDDPVLAAQWADTVRRILSWLAPLAHNMVRWQAERNFEQRSVASSGGGGDGAAVLLLLQTLHFADRRKTEAAVTELLVGLNYMWRHAAELQAKVRLQSAAGRRQLR